MIRIGDKDVGALYYGKKTISAVYKGSLLVWQAVRRALIWYGKDVWHNKDIW